MQVFRMILKTIFSQIPGFTRTIYLQRVLYTHPKDELEIVFYLFIVLYILYDERPSENIQKNINFHRL